VDYLRSENDTVHIIKYTRFIVQDGGYAKVTFLGFMYRQLDSLFCGCSAWNSHWDVTFVLNKQEQRDLVL